MITAIYIGTERLDLFEDENIVIKSNVSKISDITKVFTDTSNTFTVPATDVNNAILKHWYNPNILNGFDARKKVPAVIELGGVNFKVGKIQLNKVDIRQGKAHAYSLDYFGNLVALKDLLGNDLLTDLDLSSLDFSYNALNVRNLLTSIQDVSFSLLSKRRLLYDSNNNIANNELQTNIYYDGNNTNSGILPSDLSASVKQIKIIEAIETKYNITFSRDFFNTYDFTNQFLALTGSNALTTFQVPFNTGDSDPLNPNVLDPTVRADTMLSDGFGTPAERDTLFINFKINVASGYEDVAYNIYVKNGNDIILKKDNIKNDFSITFTPSQFNVVLSDVTFWMQVSEKIIYKTQVFRQSPNIPLYEYYTNNLTPSINFSVSKKLPKIKVVDYLSGLFKMFKLVAIPQKDGSVYVDNLTNYYKKGKLYDLTDYIDVSTVQISRGELLNRINYEFSEPQTILNNQFKEQNDSGFGDLKLDILDENGNLIDGKSLDFKLPFEQVVYEKIQDISNSEFDTNIQYGLLLDKDLKEVEIKPHIHYMETQTTNIKIVNDNNTATLLTSANIPLHVLDITSPLYSTTFGSEFNSLNNTLINDTIYTNYHKDFIERVFSEKKREYHFKAKNLPTSVVLQLSLNDVIQIKEDYYRIESFEVNTSNNDVDFKLINDRNVNITPVIPITGDSAMLKVDSTIVTADQTKY